MRWVVFVFLVLLFLPLSGLAQDVSSGLDFVLLASVVNYPDALVAGAAAAKVGVPVLLTERDEIPSDTLDVLNGLNVSEVIVVGGSAVVSDSVVDFLNDTYNVTRLWGVTRYGTAVQVAEYFWSEGVSSALLVQNDFDQSDDLVSVAKELARNSGVPVYLTPVSKVPAEVLSSLVDLGVKNVTIIGLRVSDDYRDSLGSVNISISEELVDEDVGRVKRRVMNKVKVWVNDSSTLHVVASSGFAHSLVVSNLPGSTVVLVRSLSDVGDVVDLVNDRNISRVVVVGEPVLGGEVVKVIENSTNATVISRVGRASEVIGLSKNLTHSKIVDFVKSHRVKVKKWVGLRRVNAVKLRFLANQSLQRVEGLIGNNSSSELYDEFLEAEKEFDEGHYFKARKLALKILNALHRDKLRSVDVSEEVSDEVKSLHEKVEELRELNKEFADELKSNVKEALNIIDDFKHERKEKVMEIVRSVKGVRSISVNKIRRVKSLVREKERVGEFEFETGCSSDVGNSFSVSGEGLRIKVRGVVGLPDPGFKAVRFVSVDDDSKVVKVGVYLSRRKGFTVECVGSGKFDLTIPVSSGGDWTVDLNVFVRGSKVFSSSKVVTLSSEISSENDDVESVERVVSVSEQGFTPNSLTINKGDVVVFRVVGDGEFWPASDVHPTHSFYPESGGCIGSSFDACKGLKSGEEYEFKFNEVGTWYYHDHLNPGNKGVIIVK